MKRAAVYGSLVDLKNVNSHKSIRLTVDIPAERAAEVIGMFGWPTMADPVPVALAKMVLEERKAPARSLAQQAGALCSNPVFQMFMQAENSEICAELVRDHCQVETRADIRGGTPAGDLWLDLLQSFHGWEAAEKAGAT
jgi:hypothetical protein